ncbi:hypothetical protein TomMM35A_17670 [Sphingobium sp. TomMM35A]
MHEFDFQIGEWRVRHQKLRRRLVGSTDWAEFDGSCKAWTVMDGDGSVEDQFLEDPDGFYRAAAFRRRDPQTGDWSIWWFDSRATALDPPVIGRFVDGVGHFYADDILDNRPIRVRFIWSQITAVGARWEQAFSADSGQTWETNWVMTFTREA